MTISHLSAAAGTTLVAATLAAWRVPALAADPVI